MKNPEGGHRVKMIWKEQDNWMSKHNNVLLTNHSRCVFLGLYTWSLLTLCTVLIILWWFFVSTMKLKLRKVHRGESEWVTDSARCAWIMGSTGNVWTMEEVLRGMEQILWDIRRFPEIWDCYFATNVGKIWIRYSIFFYDLFSELFDSTSHKVDILGLHYIYIQIN